VPRTTLHLEDDALEVAKAHAARHRTTLGHAVSELVRQGAERPLVTKERRGLHVLQLRRSSPRVTSAHIRAISDDTP
jgi:uncharacterized protein YbbK (DUF523 family)